MEYKGYNINKSEENGRFFVSQCGGYSTEFAKYEGYSSLNTAKGAITKHLNSLVERTEDTSFVPEPCDLCGTAFGKYGCGCVLEPEATISSDRYTNPDVHVGMTCWKIDDPVEFQNNIKSIMGHVKDVNDYWKRQSRNKREGKYAGKFRQYAGLTIYGDKMYSKNPRGKKSHHYRDQRKSFQLT